MVDIMQTIVNLEGIEMKSKVIFPKGFLSKLSDKCLKELSEVANTFQHEEVVSYNNYLSELHNNSQKMGGTSYQSKFLEIHNDLALVLRNGFVLSEEPLRHVVEFYELSWLKKKEKEFNELKKSLSSIGNVVKEFVK